MNTQTIEIKMPSIIVANPDMVNYKPYFNQGEENAIVYKKQEKIEVKGSKAYAFSKRAFDLFCSSLAIIILSPLLLILSMIVKFSSKGPVLFKDKRIGLDGKEIKVYKFRSMYIDAESNIRKYLTEEQIKTWKIERKLDNDPRITKIGKFLRKTSLDELPQLFNIFAGTLSIVGPRPITFVELKENYTPYERRKLLSVKPGLTGYWQVYGRSDVDYKSGERQKEELAYLPKRSFFFDLKLIFLTIPAVLKHKGAK